MPALKALSVTEICHFHLFYIWFFFLFAAKWRNCVNCRRIIMRPRSSCNGIPSITAWWSRRHAAPICPLATAAPLIANWRSRRHCQGKRSTVSAIAKCAHIFTFSVCLLFFLYFSLNFFCLICVNCIGVYMYICIYIYVCVWQFACLNIMFAELER